MRILARGYAGLLAALAMDLVALPARHVRENWIGADAPGRQLLRPLVPAGGAVLVALTTIILIDGYRDCGPAWLTTRCDGRRA